MIFHSPHRIGSLSSLSLVVLLVGALGACNSSSSKKTGTAGTDGGGSGADGQAGSGGAGGSGGVDAAAGMDGGAAGGADAAAGTSGSDSGAATDAAGADGATTDGEVGSDAPAESAVTEGGDGPAGDGSNACDGQATCVAVAGSLSGLLWQLPCSGAVSGAVCSTTASAAPTAMLAGTTGTTYDVTLHFRGVVEQKTYAGGCAPSTNTMWLSGGADNGDGYNVYRLSISSPPQTYFLNAGSSGIQHTFAIDFQQTVRIDAGATVTLFDDPKDGQEIMNVGADGTTPLTIAGTTVTQPYNGQFIEMDVVSLAADPVSSSAAVGGGSGGSSLTFDGSQGQRVTVADATSLDPANLTVEGWFTLSAPVGSYAVAFGKGYGGGAADSYGLWYESGALHAGVNLDSTSGSASTSWTVTAGQWHHAVEVYDATAMLNLLYVDGGLAACTPGTPPITYDTHAVLLGGDTENGGFGGFWSGALDEVRVFSTVRTADQIWADMHTHTLGPTTGLVGEWTFDEGSGQSSADKSGTGNTGRRSARRAPPRRPTRPGRTRAHRTDGVRTPPLLTVRARDDGRAGRAMSGAITGTRNKRGGSPVGDGRPPTRRERERLVRLGTALEQAAA